MNEDGATVFIILSDGESRDRAQYYDKKTFDYFKDITRMRIAVGVADADKKELVKTFICCLSSNFIVLFLVLIFFVDGFRTR